MIFNKEFKITFKVKRVITNDFVNVDIIDTFDYNCEIKNCCLSADFNIVYPGDVFSCVCEFVENKNYGYILVAKDYPVITIPSSESELAKYVSSQIKGLSKKSAEKIINKLGINFIAEVNKDNNQLKGLKLTKQQRENLIIWCENHINLHEILGEAYLRGISPCEIFEIYKRYGYDAIRIIITNPYSLYLYGLITLKNVDKIAIKEGIEKKDYMRIAAYIYSVVENYENNGSMAITKEILWDEMNGLGFDDDELWKSLDYLIEHNFLERASFNEVIYYGKKDNMQAERIIADYVKQNKELKKYDKKIIEKNFKGSELNKQQKEAVYESLSRKISLLVGGPGTGKTFTIKRIIRTVKAINPEIKIALMAPTGKAASRMVEMIGENATTIHAAFGISEGDDLIRKTGMILDKDLIIIDEVSMVDEILFSYVCRHVSKETQIILVGDSGQLASVEAGNLLESLSKDVYQSELTTICRQDKTSAIVVNAHRIRNKEFDDIEFNDSDFVFIETENVVDKVNEVYQKCLKDYNVDEIMILSPQHDKNGTNQINNLIQKENKEEFLISNKDAKYKKGDRVIQLKNVKELEIHNGDLGEVDSLTEKGINVLFNDKDEVIEIKDLKNIELAYAITVHKSQGSESDIVIMIFNDSHIFTLSNKLVYTALTRTKKKFIGIGNKKSFFRGCRKQDAQRISLISEYIGEYHKKEKIEDNDNDWFIEWLNN